MSFMISVSALYFMIMWIFDSYRKLDLFYLLYYESN